MCRTLWIVGTVIAAAGMQVFIVWGTVSPAASKVQRSTLVHLINQTQALPFNGAEKNYLEYLFPRPEYLVTCLYAANSSLMGTSLIHHPEPSWLLNAK